MSQPALPNSLLLVLGMHRSGSSAATRCLSMLGPTLPATLIKDNASNRAGHWESQPITRLNDAWLNDAGLSWADWTTGRLDRMPSAKQRDFAADLRAVIASEFPTDRPAVLKDPRLCRLVPLYRAALAEDLPISAIIVLRNPLEVMDSLVRRNRMSPANAALLWLRYMLDAIGDSEGLPRAVIAYDQLLADPVEALQRAEAALGQTFPIAPDRLSSDLTAFLSAGLRHHDRRAEEVIHDDLTRGWISDSNDALRILCSDPTNRDALARLSQIRAEFDAAAPLLATVMLRYDTALERIRLDETAQRARAELRDNQVGFLRDELAAQSAEIARLSADDALAQAHRREKRRLQDRMKELEEEVQRHRNAYHTVTNARSWRITAPLRKGGDLARRVLQRGKYAARPQPGIAPRKAATRAEDSDTPGGPAADSNIATLASAQPTAPPDPADLAQVAASPLFDPEYYLSLHPEAGNAEGGAAGHYLTTGWHMGFDPSPAFTSRAYEQSHDGVLEHDVCPLLDFQRRYPEALAQLSGEASAPKPRGRVAVFTAISRDYDSLKEPTGPTGNADFFVFTDGDVAAGSAWRKRAFEYVDTDPVRTARYVKTHPHLWFGEYDYAIWIDANLTLRCDPTMLLPAADAAAPLHGWAHPLRDCAYEEGAACIRRGKDDSDIITAQLDALRARNLPQHAGLYETSVIVTKLSDPRIAPLYRQWWAEIAAGSRRDQIGLPVALKEVGLDMGLIAPNRICMRSDPRFIYDHHAKPVPVPHSAECAA